MGEDSLETKRGDGAEDPQTGCSCPGRRATWICCTMLRSWTRNSFASLALSDSPLRAWESWLCRRKKKEQGYFHILTSSSCRRSRRVRIGAGHGARSLRRLPGGAQPSAAPWRRPPAPAALGVGREKGGLATSSAALDLGGADPVCLPGCLIPGAGRIPRDKLPLGDISPFGGLQTARGF